MLHPSSVCGDEGLEAFLGILMTYFKKGGFALHGNVFDANVLKDAQQHPEKYQTLQVRVCGWNAYFVNLSKIEQDCFIRQAEG
jgi:formate C-acetyltransferase